MRVDRPIDDIDPLPVPGDRSSKPSSGPVVPTEWDIFRYFKHELPLEGDGDESSTENFRK